MTIKQARLEARLKEEVYTLLKQAAEITGNSLSSFVIDSAYEKAIKTIAEHSIIQLSLQNQQKLIKYLSEPYLPNKRMEKAMARHKLLFDENRNGG